MKLHPLTWVKNACHESRAALYISDVMLNEDDAYHKIMVKRILLCSSTVKI